MILILSFMKIDQLHKNLIPSNATWNLMTLKYTAGMKKSRFKTHGMITGMDEIHMVKWFRTACYSNRWSNGVATRSVGQMSRKNAFRKFTGEIMLRERKRWRIPWVSNHRAITQKPHLLIFRLSESVKYHKFVLYVYFSVYWVVFDRVYSKSRWSKQRWVRSYCI